MKTFAPTLTLLLIVAAVGGYIYFNERGPIADVNSAVLLRVDPNALNSIELTSVAAAPTPSATPGAAKPGAAKPGATPAGPHSLALKKSGDAWLVQRQNKGTAPPVPADEDTVKNLLDQVKLVQLTAVIPNDPSKLKDYGLDEPTSTITVGQDKIEFGSKPSFDASKVYARVGSQIGLLPASFADMATKSYDDWRDKSILRVTLYDTKQVQVQAPAVTATFVKTEPSGSDTSATWNLTQPVAAPADASTVEGLINQLPTTKTTRFLDDNPKKPTEWGLDKPLATLTVKLKDAERTLKVGKKLKSGYAAQNSTSPAIFEITDATYGLINRPLKEWRSKNVVKIDLADLTALDVTARHATRSFTKSGEKWTATGAAPATGNAASNADTVNQAVVDLLLGVQGLTAEDFIDKPAAPDTYGFDKPAAEFKITSSKESSPITVQLGVKGAKMYARTGPNGNFTSTVYVVPKTALSGIKSPLDTLFPQPVVAGGKPVKP